MLILYTALGIAGWQGVLWAMYHFGEIDTFWFVVLEVPSVVGSSAVLFFAWLGSLDWRT